MLCKKMHQNSLSIKRLIVYITLFKLEVQANYLQSFCFSNSVGNKASTEHLSRMKKSHRSEFVLLQQAILTPEPESPVRPASVCKSLNLRYQAQDQKYKYIVSEMIKQSRVKEVTRTNAKHKEVKCIGQVD